MTDRQILEDAVSFIESLSARPLLTSDDLEMTLDDVQRHAGIEAASLRKRAMLAARPAITAGTDAGAIITVLPLEWEHRDSISTADHAWGSYEVYAHGSHMPGRWTTGSSIGRDFPSREAAIAAVEESHRVKALEGVTLAAITPETAEAVPVAAEPGEAVREADGQAAINAIMAMSDEEIIAASRPGDGDMVQRAFERAKEDVKRLAALPAPAPAGEVVEPVAWLCIDLAAGRAKSVTFSKGLAQDRERYRYYGSPAWEVHPLYAHPAPEDTARLREEAERFLVDLSAALGGLSRYTNEKGDRRSFQDWSAFLLKKAEELRLENDASRRKGDTAERERDDARKALETLEAACERLAAIRSHGVYLHMLDDEGAGDALRALDEARAAARSASKVNLRASHAGSPTDGE